MGIMNDSDGVSPLFTLIKKRAIIGFSSTIGYVYLCFSLN